MREFSKRIRKAFKRLCDPFKRTLNGYKRIFPLNGKALVSVFAFQVTYGLTKLEFTTSVFEEIYQKQQDELRLAIAGISKEYELSEFVSHLEVSTDTWFRWSTEEREK